MPHSIILDVASPAPSTNSVHVAAASYPACVETVTYESDYWHWAQPAPTTAVMNTPDLPTFSPALYPTPALLFFNFFDSPIHFGALSSVKAQNIVQNHCFYLYCLTIAENGLFLNFSTIWVKHFDFLDAKHLYW